MANDHFRSADRSTGGSDKMVKFVDLCDTFHLPVVNFVDQPGFLIGREAEMAERFGAACERCMRCSRPRRRGLRSWCARLSELRARAMESPPGSICAYAWPSADWGSLPIEGGIEAAYKRDLAASSDPEKLRRELEEKFNAVRSPLRTAEAFGIEEMIDPRDTRRFWWIGCIRRMRLFRLSLGFALV